MMLALVVAGGKAFGQNEQSVIVGCKYDYTLTNVASAVNAVATVTWETDTDVSISPSTFNIVGGAAATTLSFEVTYGAIGDEIANGLIRVVVTNSGVGGCSNYITYPVTVSPSPTYTLSISKDEATYSYDACQARTTVPVLGNQANATEADDDELNTFTFTVTPVIEDVPDGAAYTYTYSITLPSLTGLNDFTISSTTTTTIATGTVTQTGTGGTAPTPDVFTVTFHTTTNLAAQDLVASIEVSTSELTLTEDDCVAVTATQTSGGEVEQTVRVNSVPAIGSFQ